MLRVLFPWQILEQEEFGTNEKGLMRYLVYRGLTHHRMGHHQWALQFLSRGKSAYMAGNPGWLPSPIVVQMDQALAQLGGGGGGSAPMNPGPTPTPVPEPVPGGAPEPVDIQ